MVELCIGERVSLGGRVFVVHGFTPLSVSPGRVHLEDVETGEWLEVSTNDVQAEAVKADAA
jgi:hypothetical protein